MQLLVAQVHPVPAIDTSVRPVGIVSVTVTVPFVGPAPAAFDTVTVYVAPLCPCVKFPVCVFVIPSTGLEPVPVLNVPVTVSNAAGMLNVQVAPTTTHKVGVPLHPLKDEPVGGVSVKTTGALYVAMTEQPAIPAAGPQLMLPPSLFTMLLVIVPPAVPARTTVSKYVFTVNAAVAVLDVELLTVKAQVFVGDPLQGPAVQPLKLYPVAGVAVNVTCVPDAKFVEQTLGGSGLAQLISVATVGFDVLVTPPLPVIVTAKGFSCVVNVGLTV